MRFKKQFDRATSLELLISLLLSKNHYAYEQYNYAKFSKHFSLLFCLLSLETENNSTNLGELSLKLLRYLYKTSGNNYRWKAPNDLFSDAILKTQSLINIQTADLFNHKQGCIHSNETYTDTRFGDYLPEYLKIELSYTPPLGEIQKPESTMN